MLFRSVLKLDFKRIQFTPDLMPADILGSEVLEETDSGRRSFRFIEGPVFAQLLMADEINRASPRTQSALLQSMQEKHVTVAGKRYDLPAPFHVLATQNPLEQEGTYPLPEAQLDRFLLQVDVGYPDEEAERQIMIATTGSDVPVAVQALSPADLMAAQALVRRLPIGQSVVDAILKLVRAGRPEHSDLDVVKQRVAWGPGPRASQAFMLACRARAIIQGRLAPSVDDVVALAGPILRHRMAVNFSARAEGVTHEDMCIQMQGREVFRFATRVMIDSATRLLHEAGLTVDDVDLLVAHQANERILDHAVEKLEIPREKVVMNLDRYGNTSSASIPIALAEAVVERGGAAGAGRGPVGAPGPAARWPFSEREKECSERGAVVYRSRAAALSREAVQLLGER